MGGSNPVGQSHRFNSIQMIVYNVYPEHDIILAFMIKNIE